MMWIEASFSALLLFSAMLLAMSSSESSSDYQKNWVEFGHLNDAAHILSSKLSENKRIIPAVQLPTATPALDAADALQSEAQFVLGTQNLLDSLSRGTPYCLELSAKNHPLHAVSCRGEAPENRASGTAKSSFSVERAALHNGVPLIFSLRQWTDTNQK